MRQMGRQSLSVAEMLNQKLFDHVYRSDGKETKELVHTTAGATGTFTWQYTPGGRVLQRTDPTAGDPARNHITIASTTNGPLVVGALFGTAHSRDGVRGRHLRAILALTGSRLGVDCVVVQHNVGCEMVHQFDHTLEERCDGEQSIPRV
jgi:hypothetical protein